MDAPGTAANLTQLFAQVVNYATAVANAPRNQGNLIGAVTNCELVLQQLKCAANASTEDTAWINTINALERPGAPLERMQFILGRIKQEIEPKKGLRKAIHQVKWPFRQKELNELLIEIEREKSNLQLIVASHTRQLDTEIRNISSQHKDQLLSLNRMVSGMRDNIHQLVQTQNNPPSQGNLSSQPLVSAMGRLTFSNSNNGYTMDAQNMKDIIFPLMCLMPSLLEILPQITNRSELNLTADDGKWLKEEFQQLLRSAHLAGARGQGGEGSTNGSVALGVKRKRKADDEARGSVEMIRKRRYNRSASIRLGRTREVERIAKRYETPVGILVIETELEQDDTTFSIIFSFTPDHNILPQYRRGFMAMFRRHLDQQNIQRCLRTYRAVDWHGSAFEAISSGDLCSLKTLLNDRVAFPTDRLLDTGDTLIGHACRELQLPACEFLLVSLEGTDPCEADNDGMNALRQLIQGFQDELLLDTSNTESDARLSVVRKLLKSGCLEYESWEERDAEDGCLHLAGFQEQSTFPTNELSMIVSSFLMFGAGLEIRDIFGKTPLLDNLAIPGEMGLGIVDDLLKGGADVKAVDSEGNGVFHLTLLAYQKNANGLEKRLPLLMKYCSSADLHLTNHQGYTASDFAFTRRLWSIWCAFVQKQIGLQKALMGDRISKVQYEQKMNHPREPMSRKKASKTTLVRPDDCPSEATTPASTGPKLDTYHEIESCQCPYTILSVPFVSWEAQETRAQQLPGLPRCSACSGFILPGDMEARKQEAYRSWALGYYA